MFHRRRRHRRHRHSRARTVLIGAAGLALAVTACSDGTDAGTPAAADTSAASGSVDAAALLETGYAGFVGEVTSMATEVPADQSVWIVSCGQAVTTCAAPAAAMEEAAEAVGWTAQTCDGQLNPAGWAACIRQGISAGADVITVVGQDCSSFSAPLQEATAAGIITVGVGGNNCDVDGAAGGYTGITQKMADLTAQEWYNRMGALQADWVIAKTNGEATVLSLLFTDTTLGQWVQDGFVEQIETCAGCTISRTLEIGNQDVGGGTMTTKFSTALLQDPSINAVNVPLDGWFLAGLAQAVESSGRSEELSVIGAFGEPGNLDLIRQGTGQDATVAFSEAWDGWGGIDTAIRLMNGEPAQPQGIGLQVVDQDKNLPAEGELFAYNPVIDYEAAYQQAWGQ